MAVTETEHRTRPSASDEVEQDSARRDDEKNSEDLGSPQADGPERSEPECSESGQPEGSEADERKQPDESHERKQPKKSQRAKGIAGGVGIFLVLAIYFVWIGSEMGSHAISGTFEMWAIFGAIFLGVAALLAGGAISQKAHDGGHVEPPDEKS